ncbi:MAG: sulfatase-like hydrolase/transferase [Phycisphaerae bacterium]|nr:sulfatase-like hydrolase/transferase [Phycisphaerae bacterium]
MKKTGRPNFIVFLTDQQRWDSTGVHGNPLGLTPNFDAMAAGGTHAFNAFTCQPVCGPARSCLQTGLYATTTGCYCNGAVPQPGQKMLGHYFRQAGYSTGYIGKWHLANQDPVPVGQRGGYQHWLAANLLEMTSDSYRCDVFDEKNNPVRLPGYRVDGLTDAAIRFVDANRQNPFFLFLSFLEPHQQNHLDNYPAPEGYRQQYQGRWMPADLEELGGVAARHLGGYWGMVKRLDEALGRIRDALKSLALTDNTVILFTSDHGCHFKTRNDEFKRSCHESSIRVPTALYGGPFTGGGQLRQLVSLIDLAPTLLDAAGIAVPRAMQGRSLLPLLRGRSPAWPQEVFVQISESQVGRAIRTHQWKYGVTAPDKDGWKDSQADQYVEQYLYDLEADPAELNNLAGAKSHLDIAQELKGRLLARMVRAGETKPIIRPAPRA